MKRGLEGIGMSFKTTLLSTSSAFVFSFFIQSASLLAADIDPKGDLCAVSGPNGKINVNGGFAGDQANSTSGAYGFNGSLSLPLGCDLGVQLDAGFQHELGDTTYGGVGHFFMRDPNSYLLGMTGGYFKSNDASTWAVGPEVELYSGQFSFEAWAGLANVDVNGIGSSNKGFAFADAAFYATDDLRLSLGASMLGESKFLNAGMEYQVSDPVSLTLDGKIGDDEYVAVNAGLTLYFGETGNKSLIRRHREDDPRNRLLGFQAANSSTVKKIKKAASLKLVTTPAPTTTLAAATTSAPTTTLAAETTPAPTTTLAAETTPAPTTTEVISTTPAPTTTEVISTTPSPTSTSGATTTPDCGPTGYWSGGECLPTLSPT
jgi:hypothetical protein